MILLCNISKVIFGAVIKWMADNGRYKGNLDV